MKNSWIIECARIVCVLAIVCCLTAATGFGQGASASCDGETGKHLRPAPIFSFQGGRPELRPPVDPAAYAALYACIPGDAAEGGIVVLPEGKRFKALQEAFDFCSSGRGDQRGVVLVPPGTHYGPFTLPPAGITVVGVYGKLATTLDCPAGSGPTITFSPGGAGIDRSWLSGLWIVGQETAAIDFAASPDAHAHLIIENCHIDGRNGFPAIKISGDGANQTDRLGFDMHYSDIESDGDGIVATTGDNTAYAIIFSFISAGGTSLILMLGATGILVNVSKGGKG